MPAYATQADITIIYGEAVLDAVASRDGSGRKSYEAVEAALQAASDEIDTYLGVRYTVPLETPPPYIKMVCVDIAVYRLALDVGPRTEEMRLRYTDAISYLKSVADGKFELPDTGGGTDPGGGENSAGTGARVIGAKRG
jgi:phage gp36-like protein